MSSKRTKTLLIVFLLILTFAVASASSYKGYADAKKDCEDNDKAVEEETISFLAFNWSVTCN
ncbi:hypothetical protein [Alteribacillus sp. HJP-4]|uniref:hypothetical protein n=1 Tax=Alteribacillus sp. HJP-4 TaxID=2775394 RepID=UPI0035CCE185